MTIHELSEKRGLSRSLWLTAAVGLGGIALWVVNRTATRTADYGFETFTKSEVLGSHGPFDLLIVFCLATALLAIVLGIFATPGLVIYRLFSERLLRRNSPQTVRLLIVPAATILFWALLLLLLFSAGCSRGRVFLGNVSLPVSLYEGTSHPVHLELREDLTSERLNQALEGSTIDENTRVSLVVSGESQAIALQVELLAPDVEIGGESKLSQELNVDVLQYDWVLNFKSPGTKLLSLVFRLSDRSGKTTTVGHIDHRIDVTRLGFLTKGQAAGLATFTGVLSVLSMFVALFKPLVQRQRAKKKPVIGFSSSTEK